MRSRYSIQEKFDMIMNCRNSGLSDYQWCKQHGVSPSTFYGWVNQVRKQNCEIPDPAGLETYAPTTKQDVVKLDIIEESQNTYTSASKTETTNCAIEISIGAATIKISNDINPALFSNLLTLLGGNIC